MQFRNLVLGSLLLSPLAHGATSPKIFAIANPGAILVDGKSISANTEIPASASLLTSGPASIKIGTDNVMNIAAGSQLNLVPEKDGRVGISLQKGAVEGVRRIDPGLKGATTIATKAGEFEVPGGRYEIKVGDEANAPVQFRALDVTASLAPTAGSTEKSLALLPQSQITINGAGPGASPAEARIVVAAPNREIASAGAGKEAAVFLPRVPEEVRAGEPVMAAAPKPNPGLDSPLLKPNPINRDPLQTPKNPTVTVKFQY